MVCERSDAFASACALARAFPLFTQRSAASRRPEKKTVTVEFFLVGQDNGPVEVSTLQVGVWKLRPGPRAALPAAPQLGQSSLSHSLGGQDRAAGIPEKDPRGLSKAGQRAPSPEGGLVLRVRFCSASVYRAPAPCQALSCFDTNNPARVYIALPFMVRFYMCYFI